MTPASEVSRQPTPSSLPGGCRGGPLWPPPACHNRARTHHRDRSARRPIIQRLCRLPRQAPGRRGERIDDHTTASFSTTAGYGCGTVSVSLSPAVNNPRVVRDSLLGRFTIRAPCRYGPVASSGVTGRWRIESPGGRGIGVSGAIRPGLETRRKTHLSRYRAGHRGALRGRPLRTATVRT